MDSRLRRAAVTTLVAVGLPAGVVIWAAHGLPGLGSAEPPPGATGTREIVLRAYTWGFAPAVVHVHPEETVRFRVQSEDIQHGFAVNELGLNLQLAPGREVRTPELRVGLAEGRYTIHCSVFCGLGHPAMKAKLVVGDPAPPPGRALPWAATLGAAAVGAVLLARTVRGSPWSGPARPARGGRDLLALGFVGRVVRLRAFQFLLVLPAAALVGLVMISSAVGVDHPGFNFGTVVTWVVWWGGLLLSLVLLGRIWCLVCPVGAVGDWVQRLCLWGRTRYAPGFGVKWPKSLRSLWVPTLLFGAFVWLDSGYGVANSPRLTAALIVTLLLASAWVGLIFERRTFCRYVCPLTSFLGLASLAAMVELRARDPGVCQTRCASKDCYRGNARHHGCPMGAFPGGGMDSNLDCTLCTECVRGCPHDNLGVWLRPPGRDLWAMRRPRADGAAASAIVVGLASLVPFLMVLLLPGVRSLAAGWIAGEGARLIALTLVFLVGAATSVALVRAFSHLAHWVAGVREVPARRVFVTSAHALLPVGLAKFLADLADHAFRTWGTLGAVTRALLADFPWNRAVPAPLSAVHLLGAEATYLIQVALLLAGLGLSLHAMSRIALRLFGRPEVAAPGLLPLAGLGVLFTLVNVWTLGMPLL